MVLVGAEGVVESGGIINKLGTYQIAICAKAHNVPLYVAAESYKVWCRRLPTSCLRKVACSGFLFRFFKLSFCCSLLAYTL